MGGPHSHSPLGLRADPRASALGSHSESRAGVRLPLFFCPKGESRFPRVQAPPGCWCWAVGTACGPPGAGVAWNPRDAAFGWLTGWRFPCCVSGLLSNVGQRGLTWGKALLQLGELRVCVLPTWPGAEGVPWLLLGPAPRCWHQPHSLTALSLKLAGSGGGCLPPLPGVSPRSGILSAEAKLCLKNRELE